MKNEKKKMFHLVAIVSALAGMLLLVSCSTRHSQAEELGILFCETENSWHGTFYDGGPQYPNSGQEVFWLVLCEGKAVVISNRQKNPVSTYTPDISSARIRMDYGGGGFLGGGEFDWSLLFCQEEKTGHAFSRRAQYSANTKGGSVASLLQRIEAMFPVCATEDGDFGSPKR